MSVCVNEHASHQFYPMCLNVYASWVHVSLTDGYFSIFFSSLFQLNRMEQVPIEMDINKSVRNQTFTFVTMPFILCLSFLFFPKNAKHALNFNKLNTHERGICKQLININEILPATFIRIMYSCIMM